MIKLLIGGSPCTYWSIAQTNNRETEASGLGWELFRNYLIAKEKWNPDYFLYENNKSASTAIKDQIKKELGVTEPGATGDDNGVRFTCINSSLVSAQNRQRFYVTNFGDIEQPEDRGILLVDVLDGSPALVDKNDKAFAQTSTYYKLGQQSPIQVGKMPREDGEVTDSKGYRVYDVNGKAVTQCGQGGGGGAKTGLYAIKKTGPDVPVYEVKDGKITVKDKQYPIKLEDGYYIIRKLTVSECKRLQTVPDWFVFPVSNSQAFRMLGNGWTVEIIKCLLSHIPNIQNEEIEVLSMYDGMSCGQIALKEMGCNVVKYTSYEIDKYAIQTTQYNFPNTIQRGDAFQVRDPDWAI